MPIDDIAPLSYRRHRIPSAILAHAVWLYFLRQLTLRLVDEMIRDIA